MLKNEAIWLGEHLNSIEGQLLSPLLNIGSATAEFRQVVQPWIDAQIFCKLAQKGVVVKHLDITPGEGVDLIGDLTQQSFRDSLGQYGFRSAMCSNLLEHIPDPGLICRTIEDIIAPGGYIFISTPYKFPYHPDPIDTMYRPNIGEIARVFPHCERVDGQIVTCGSAWDYVEHNPGKMIGKVYKRLTSPQISDRVAGTGSFLPWLFRQFQATCVILRRCEHGS